MTEDRKAAVLPFAQRKPEGKMGMDGIVRPLDAEKKLNSLFAATFTGAAGQEVLDYLESLTLRTVSGPEASDAQLRHQEGQRHLVSIILERYRLGKENR